MAEASVEVRMFTSTQEYTLGISDYIAVRLIAISTANLIKDWFLLCIYYTARKALPRLVYAVTLRVSN